MNIFLHIGPHKTGTTAIQAFLRRNTEELRHLGYHYPCTHPSLENHHDLAIGLRSQLHRDETIHRIHGILEAAQAEGCHSVIFSSEMLAEHGIPISGFPKMFEGHCTTVLAYIRRPDHLLESAYAQLVKEDSVRRREPIEEPPTPYDCGYITIFPKWFPHFAPGQMILAPFDPPQWPNRCLFADFCRMVGIEISDRIDTAIPRLESNKALPAALVEALRVTNIALDLPTDDREKLISEFRRHAESRPDLFAPREETGLSDFKKRAFGILQPNLEIFRPYFREGFDESFLHWKEPGSGKSKSLFFDKVVEGHVLTALKKRLQPGQRAVLLLDGNENIDAVRGDARIRLLIDVRRDSPAVLDSLGDDDVVIYACTQDDLGLPFIAHLHKTGRKYFPVWSLQPGGYVFTNTTAREVLQTEFEFQKREGFSKWDFGHRDYTTLIQALEITKELPGCYLEVGCYRGSSAGAVLRYLAAKRRPMETFFLDVFDGFHYEASERSSDAVWHGTHETEGFEIVRDRLMAYGSGFPDLKITVEKNNILTDPLPEAVVERGIALANLDVDLHEAVYAGLHKIAPHIQQHGILVVEDPGHTPLLIGAKYAVEKFLGEELGRKFIPVVMDSGQVFLIRK
jgi:hypothetical protein